MNTQTPNSEKTEALCQTLTAQAEKSGYHVNPDLDFIKDLLEGLLVNQERYGYWACPCRLASGNKKDDLDMICPCDYRDADLTQYGSCYCALYVSQNVLEGKQRVSSIPDRRSLLLAQKKEKTNLPKPQKLKIPVWRCKVCGYLCGREAPPEFCPICKARSDRFEIFMQ
jgi:ferredoxin-thioredoxin reductase catalytic chain